jgi:hypothetical protein
MLQNQVNELKCGCERGWRLQECKHIQSTHYMCKLITCVGICQIHTRLLLKTYNYSKSYMAFSLLTLKVTFDLPFKATCKNSVSYVNIF